MTSRPALEELPEEVAVQAALATAAEVFGEAALEELSTDMPPFVTNWGSDPYCLGAYSFARPGAGGARAALAAQPLADSNVFFAGEALSTNAYGTIGGAYQTGVDVAQQVLQA